MDNQELAGVVAQISEAVERAGFSDKAAWLDRRARDLQSGDAERHHAARQELRGVVHGMGGLIDIYYGSAEETDRVGELIDALWQEVKAKQ